MNDAQTFLATRRSRPAKLISGPIPDDATLKHLLTCAARAPDHGKLEPWRFVVLPKAALRRLAPLARQAATQAGSDPDKAASQFETSPLAVVVVESPKASDKVPAIEQTYSTGAVCLSLLNAALAAGWAANWLSGWAAHDPAFCQDHLGLAPHERVAGLIHIGTGPDTMPDRPRPDVDMITTWRR